MGEAAGPGIGTAVVVVGGDVGIVARTVAGTAVELTGGADVAVVRCTVVGGGLMDDWGLMVVVVTIVVVTIVAAVIVGSFPDVAAPSPALSRIRAAPAIQNHHSLWIGVLDPDAPGVAGSASWAGTSLGSYHRPSDACHQPGPRGVVAPRTDGGPTGGDACSGGYQLPSDACHQPGPRHALLMPLLPRCRTRSRRAPERTNRPKSSPTQEESGWAHSDAEARRRSETPARPVDVGFPGRFVSSGPDEPGSSRLNGFTSGSRRVHRGFGVT